MPDRVEEQSRKSSDEPGVRSASALYHEILEENRWTLRSGFEKALQKQDLNESTDGAQKCSTCSDCNLTS